MKVETLIPNIKISVVMPVYNGEKYLTQAIESILHQTFTDFEFIIINDGSTDRTEEIICSYTDSRIVYVKNDTNLQISASLNRAIEIARGKYIARMDADDVSLKYRLETQYYFMEQNPDIDLCGSLMQINGNEKNIGFYPESHEAIKSRMLFKNSISHPIIFAKKTFFIKFKYDSDYNTAEDYELWTRSIIENKFYNIQQILYDYKVHTQMTSQKSQNRQKELSKIIQKNLLKNLYSNLTNDELQFHHELSNEKISLDNIEKAKSWLNTLIDYNKKSNFGDVTIFQIEIEKIWWGILYANSKLGLSMLKPFFQKELQILYKPSVIDQIKFIIKCLLCR